MDRTTLMAIISAITFDLNPYSNGIWIEPYVGTRMVEDTSVLILILMEYG